ncbi:glycosyltransferase family 4 protein [Acidicapsa acidisoli]|uniref:glycosyltransferase family 4 protein n=1 Tax=Acidicapsa acidisoli TaxID=1615681 RepID=UPI0021DFCB7A|nr:glycosyltransferase family 4 protein [Acidicapsa acidisoli]
MASTSDDILGCDSGLGVVHTGARNAPRLVMGVTSDQTCLVLRGRLRALRLAGFDVTLISSPGENLTRLVMEEGVTACPLPMRRGIAPLADLVSFVAIYRILLRLRPSITDFSTPKAGLLGNLAAWCLRVPHRVYTLRGLKLEGARGGKKRLLLWSERLAAWCSHVVLCNSESLRAAALALRIAPAGKLHLLGDGSSNGVDCVRFSPGASQVRLNLEIDDGDLVLGFVGRLTGDKGVPELLVAFEEILRAEPRCWLLLVGWFDRSEDALDLRWPAHIAGHPRIHCTGFVADTAPYYRAMDLLVLPTHREGFPNVVLEAAASGLAVITTESTGARDAVVPGVTGLLIEPKRSEAIAGAAIELLRDEERRKRFGAAARAWVLDRYTKDRVLGLAVEFYQRLIEAS